MRDKVKVEEVEESHFLGWDVTFAGKEPKQSACYAFKHLFWNTVLIRIWTLSGVCCTCKHSQ